MSLPDYNDLFNKHQAQQDRELEQLPICYECDEHIQTDECYEFNGELICPGCLKQYHRKSTDNYIRY